MAFHKKINARGTTNPGGEGGRSIRPTRLHKKGHYIVHKIGLRRRWSRASLGEGGGGGVGGVGGVVCASDARRVKTGTILVARGGKNPDHRGEVLFWHRESKRGRSTVRLERTMKRCHLVGKWGENSICCWAFAS